MSDSWEEYPTAYSGGVTVARGNSHTLLVNNLIYNNGRNGVLLIDSDGGPHYLVSNTIYLNGWNGVDGRGAVK